MCGRYTLSAPWREVADLYRLPDDFELRPRYNIAPSQPVVALRLEPERSLAWLRWGLIPSWAKNRKIAYRTINARAETAATKPAFRAAFKRRRCVIAADGYYEWKRLADGSKRPYRITRVDGAVFSFAGLWERWNAEDAEVVESCTIITTQANNVTRDLHPRMPVILAPQDYERWLDPQGAEVEALLRPCPDQWLMSYPVATMVNNPAYDRPECVDSLG